VARFSSHKLKRKPELLLFGVLKYVWHFPYPPEQSLYCKFKSIETTATFNVVLVGNFLCFILSFVGSLSWQEAKNFRLQPATNCRHQNKKPAMLKYYL